MKKKITRFQNIISNISLALAGIALITIGAAVFWAILCRFILKTSSMWVEQYTRFVMIWMVFLASNVLIRNDELMRVDFFDNIWPKRMLQIREGCYTVLFIIILFVLTWQSWRQAISYWDVPVVGLPIDKFWVYFSIPLGSVLMLVQYLLNLLQLFLSGKDQGSGEIETDGKEEAT